MSVWSLPTSGTCSSGLRYLFRRGVGIALQGLFGASILCVGTTAAWAASEPSHSSHLEVGAGALAMFGADGLAPGVLADAFWSPFAEQRISLHFGGFGSLAREDGFQGGKVSWYRAGAAAGARFRLTAHPWSFALTGDLLVSYVGVSGSGYLRNESSDGGDLGFLPMARIGFDAQSVRWWLGVGPVFWCLGNYAVVLHANGEKSLPSIEGAVATGLLFPL